MMSLSNSQAPANDGLIKSVVISIVKNLKILVASSIKSTLG